MAPRYEWIEVKPLRSRQAMLALSRRMAGDSQPVSLPVKRVLQVFKQAAQARGSPLTAVVEMQYIDRDYAEAHARFYSHSFTDYDSRCTRYHFFAADSITEDDFNPYNESGDKPWKKLRSSYLGYSVIRPSNPDTVGRSCLPLPWSGIGDPKVVYVFK